MKKKDITFEKKILHAYCVGEAFMTLIDDLPEELFNKTLKYRGKAFLKELENVGKTIGNNLYSTDGQLVNYLSNELKELIEEILGSDKVKPLELDYVPDVTIGIRKFKQENK